MLGRSRFHPEILFFDIWQRALNEPEFRDRMKTKGFRINLTEKAISMSTGWIHIGDLFIEDFMEIESILGVELVFPDKGKGKPGSVFQSYILK